MGVAVEALLRIGNLDQAQHLDGSLARPAGTEAFMDADGFGDLEADGLDRIERGHRLLEDHGDLVAAHRPHGGFAELEQIAPFEQDFATDDAGELRWQQPQQRQGGDAFAAAGLADHAQGLAGHDGE